MPYTPYKLVSLYASVLLNLIIRALEYRSIICKLFSYLPITVPCSNLRLPSVLYYMEIPSKFIQIAVV